MTGAVSTSPLGARTTEKAAGKAIELIGVTRHFGSVVAVDGIDLAINEGEFFSLLGPSGCGKTTTLRMIAGFEMPSSGKVMLQGKEIQHLPPYRRNVHTVFQSYALFPHLDVFENVAFGLRRRGAAREEIAQKVDWSLNMVQLGSFARRRIHELSGGEQQRIAMARALVTTPAVLLLDEPLSALDERLRKQMQVELKRIQREIGITFVLVTHDQEEALTLSDRIAVVNKGRIEQIGTPAEIYEHPRTRFVTEFMGASNMFDGTVEGHSGDLLEVRVEGLGVVLRIPSEGRSGDAIAAGTRVDFFVRPEKMRLASAPPTSNENGVPGVMRSTIYQGPVTRCDVELPDGHVVAVTVMNHEAPPSFATGAPLWLHWHPTSGRLLEPR